MACCSTQNAATVHVYGAQWTPAAARGLLSGGGPSVQYVELEPLADVTGAGAAPKAASGAVFNISVDASGGAQLPPAMLFETSHTPTHRVHHLARQLSAAGEEPPLFLRHQGMLLELVTGSSPVSQWDACSLDCHSRRDVARLLCRFGGRALSDWACDVQALALCSVHCLLLKSRSHRVLG